VLGGLAMPAYGQTAQPAATPPRPAAAAPAAPAPAAAPVSAPQQQTVVRSLSVNGSQRLEPETVLSYMNIRVGQPYTRESLDQALRELYATELFADVTIAGADTGDIVVNVRENPVINRIVLEGNKRLKEDKINPEIKLAPRQIFTRSKARADVARIIELYRRQGRFAASVEPKIVQLDQNRVDVVFEIREGPKSKIRQINILGNEKFSDRELRGEMATKRSGPLSFLGSGDVYDPDRLAYDQSKMRLFYLTHGYADFHVISAVAELTPDRKDFIITYVVEEGERYKFGDVKVESSIRDFKGDALTRMLPMHKGDWYNAKMIEDTVNRLNESAGLFGYAFADVDPKFERNKEERTMSVTFQLAETQRTYVERVDINGNQVTRDKVIRREFRLAEGDPFNSVRVKRSRDRIQSLGFFQENLEVKQTQGSAPDRVILGLDVEDKSTGQLQLSGGYSSIERFIINASVEERNFMGKGQEVRLGVNYSTYSKSIEAGFTEPYLFDRNIAVGVDLFRRDYSSFNYLDNNRNTTYKQITTGGQLRFGVPLTEYAQLALRYGLNFDDVTLDRGLFFTDQDGTGPNPATCDPLLAGRYLCNEIGKRTTSSIGYSLAYINLDNGVHPTRGLRAVLSQDFAGLGGDVKYVRTRLNAIKYWPMGGGFIFSVSGEGGYIHALQSKPAPDIDAIRLTDRFFLGEPQIRGFDIRGVGPRIWRQTFDANNELIVDRKQIQDDAIGGRAYYLGRAELEIPLGTGVKELNLRPSIFADVGALWGVTAPGRLNKDYCDPPATDTTGATRKTVDVGDQCPATFTRTLGFRETFLGDTPRPRVSVGIGVNWNSPFGPFRIDIAKALVKSKGDDAKLITFNVGTAF
jgi:outer membrane protein insertion porin family